MDSFYVLYDERSRLYVKGFGSDGFACGGIDKPEKGRRFDSISDILTLLREAPSTTRPPFARPCRLTIHKVTPSHPQIVFNTKEVF